MEGETLLGAEETLFVTIYGRTEDQTVAFIIIDEGREVMEGERLSWELARNSPGAPPRYVCLLRILSFYSLCRVELFTARPNKETKIKLKSSFRQIHFTQVSHQRNT